MISTGVSYIDEITGGLRLGDNVVWQVSDGVSIDSFIKAFFDTNSDFQSNIIYINSNYSPHTIKKRYDYLFQKNITLIDAFTHGKGNSDPVFLDFYQDRNLDPQRFICVENPRDVSVFTSVLNNIEKDNKDGSFYIFDSLTGLFELWKNERDVIDFFAFKCPKLYDLNTLAYWIFERDAHSKEFIASITHITQVIFALNASHMDYYQISINKLENRSSFHDIEPRYFRIIDKEIRFKSDRIDEVIRIGEKVKKLRKEKKITQSELAMVLGMTAGAISQIENNLISPSLQSLVQMAAFFNKPLGYFIGTELENEKDRGYQLTRKSSQRSKATRPVMIEELVEHHDISIKPYAVTVAKNSIIEGPILLHKGTEYLTVTGGTIDLVINSDTVSLNKGDSLILESSFISQWKTAGQDCEMVYILLK
ncbi:MAG: hypothetical protein CVV44_01865 [Spirochaetae bacterium HGW-Spirochaetae-1]|nr:MAG: hypothetical protein CVV44_01865 [Spirochaetae bacterium HGW-Spirochaetae-1]